MEEECECSDEWQPSEEDIVEERAYFQRTLVSFSEYKKHSYCVLRRLFKNFLETVSEKDRQLIGLERRMDTLKRCVDSNAKFLTDIISPYHCGSEEPPVGVDPQEWTLISSESSISKVRSTLKQFCRDWSEEGKVERENCYKPLFCALDDLFPTSCDRSKIHVLVPGAGLGRLAWEIHEMGFDTEGNEFSFHMLIPSNYILNAGLRIGSVSIFPFIHETSNIVKFEDAVRPILIPDVDIADSHELVRKDEQTEKRSDPAPFSMCAGDFVDVYSRSARRGSFDCVVTCFFLDTARNIFKYIDVLRDILRPGGIWLNIGPLLYHYADVHAEKSVEITYEEVMSVIRDRGFSISREEMHECTYTTNEKSMMTTMYHCGFFVAKR